MPAAALFKTKKNLSAYIGVCVCAVINTCAVDNVPHGIVYIFPVIRERKKKFRFTLIYLEKGVCVACAVCKRVTTTTTTTNWLAAA